jgi:hypothetical protein
LFRIKRFSKRRPLWLFGEIAPELEGLLKAVESLTAGSTSGRSFDRAMVTGWSFPVR